MLCLEVKSVSVTKMFSGLSASVSPRSSQAEDILSLSSDLNYANIPVNQRSPMVQAPLPIVKKKPAPPPPVVTPPTPPKKAPLKLP